MNLPFAAAADQNKVVILEALVPYLRGRVLEIGSGTGQHAVHFAAALPELDWQTSDLAPNLGTIGAWIEQSGLQNLRSPIELDVSGTWPQPGYDTVYSANCFHIMDADQVANCMRGCGGVLVEGGYLAVYGPFNYAGQYTSPSNERFDAALKANDPASGIKDFDWLDALATDSGLELETDIAMPANNRCLVWKKRTL